MNIRYILYIIFINISSRDTNAMKATRGYIRCYRPMWGAGFYGCVFRTKFFYFKDVLKVLKVMFRLYWSVLAPEEFRERRGWWKHRKALLGTTSVLAVHRWRETQDAKTTERNHISEDSRVGWKRGAQGVAFAKQTGRLNLNTGFA